MAYNFDAHIENEGLRKVTGSHKTRFTIKVVISQKRCKTETLLLQIT